MVCSNSRCKMSMFLVNELVIDDESSKQITRRQLNTRTYPKFWNEEK